MLNNPVLAKSVVGLTGKLLGAISFLPLNCPLIIRTVSEKIISDIEKASIGQSHKNIQGSRAYHQALNSECTFEQLTRQMNFVQSLRKQLLDVHQDLIAIAPSHIASSK